MTLYRIPDLEWENPRKGRYLSATVVGHYEIYKIGGWFLDPPNDYAERCKSLKDAKSKANAHYRERMARGLVEVAQDTKGTP